jgi:tRNA dimethylallyltransferase
MFKKGAVEEVESLEGAVLSRTAYGLIGIKEIRKFLEGKISLEAAKEEIKKHTRHLAKKQMTWFRKEKRIKWLKIKEENAFIRPALAAILGELDKWQKG